MLEFFLCYFKFLIFLNSIGIKYPAIKSFTKNTSLQLETRTQILTCRRNGLLNIRRQIMHKYLQIRARNLDQLAQALLLRTDHVVQIAQQTFVTQPLHILLKHTKLRVLIELELTMTIHIASMRLTHKKTVISHKFCTHF